MVDNTDCFMIPAIDSPGDRLKTGDGILDYVDHVALVPGELVGLTEWAHHQKEGKGYRGLHYAEANVYWENITSNHLHLHTTEYNGCCWKAYPSAISTTDTSKVGGLNNSYRLPKLLFSQLNEFSKGDVVHRMVVSSQQLGSSIGAIDLIVTTSSRLGGYSAILLKKKYMVVGEVPREANTTETVYVIPAYKIQEFCPETNTTTGPVLTFPGCLLCAPHVLALFV